MEFEYILNDSLHGTLDNRPCLMKNGELVYISVRQRLTLKRNGQGEYIKKVVWWGIPNNPTIEGFPVKYAGKHPRMKGGDGFIQVDEDDDPRPERDAHCRTRGQLASCVKMGKGKKKLVLNHPNDEVKAHGWGVHLSRK